MTSLYLISYLEVFGCNEKQFCNISPDLIQTCYACFTTKLYYVFM